MLTYQKLSCRTIPLSIAKLMGNQSEENSKSRVRSNLKPTSQADSGTQEDSGGILKTSDRNIVIDDGVETTATILIVDDTPNNLQVLFSYLETAGFKVLLAEDGESALQIAQSQTPDLILLDVLMPNIDGFETCSRLKVETSTKEIPVIFLTALSETVNKVQGFKLGGVDYITKPIVQEEMLARIQTHLNLQRMRRTLGLQNRKLQQTLDFNASVRRITDKIRDSLNENSCLQIATEELATVLNLGSCQVELYDREQITATIVREHSVTLPSCQGETREINDFPELYQQLLQKSPLQSVEAFPQFNPPGIQVSRLACPIFDDRGIIGNLWGLKPPEEVFTPLEIKLMQQVASQCAIAIRQARLYANSNRQIAELAKLNQLKNDFLKTVSHELKAPMSSIQLAAQTLENLLNNTKKPHKSPLFKRVLKIFQDSCQQQKQLVDDLLTVCYVDAQTKIIQPEVLELNFWLTDIIKPYLEGVKNRQQELILDIATEEILITVDLVILERIVGELLSTACKYTPSGGTITVKTESTVSRISLSIANSNEEISTEDAGKYGVKGLGLTLVKRLVEILGATIEMKSDRHHTIFCVIFPLIN